MSKMKAIILAGGKGTRMKSELPKYYTKYMTNVLLIMYAMLVWKLV